MDDKNNNVWTRYKPRKEEKPDSVSVLEDAKEEAHTFAASAKRTTAHSESILAELRKGIMQWTRWPLQGAAFWMVLLLLFWLLIISIFTWKMLIIAFESTNLGAYFRVTDFLAKTSLLDALTPITAVIAGLIGWFLGKRDR